MSEEEDPPPGGSKAARAEATRGALVRAARELFAERGYAAVGTEEIVRSAEVTRGALYHHFQDKRDLLRAVHEQLEQELVASIGERIAGVEDPWELLVTGLRAYLDACTDRALIQIALIDAPSVLGWKEWREVDARYGLGLVIFGLTNAMDAGAMRRVDVRPFAHLMLGALTEAAFLIANADDPDAARAEVEGPMMDLLEGLRAS